MTFGLVLVAQTRPDDDARANVGTFSFTTIDERVLNGGMWGWSFAAGGEHFTLESIPRAAGNMIWPGGGGWPRELSQEAMPTRLGFDLMGLYAIQGNQAEPSIFNIMEMRHDLGVLAPAGYNFTNPNGAQPGITRVWNPNGTLSTAIVAAGNTFNAPTNLPTADPLVPLVAVWRPVTFNIVFDFNGGSGIAPTNFTTHVNNGFVPAQLNNDAPTRATYVFNGWTHNPHSGDPGDGSTSGHIFDAQGRPVTDPGLRQRAYRAPNFAGEVVPQRPFWFVPAGAQTITLVADWVELTHLVTIDANGGEFYEAASGLTPTIVQLVRDGGNVSVPRLPEVSLGGAEFAFWSTNIDADPENYEEYAFDWWGTTVTGEITIYAIWFANFVDLVLDARGGWFPSTGGMMVQREVMADIATGSIITPIAPVLAGDPAEWRAWFFEIMPDNKAEWPEWVREILIALAGTNEATWHYHINQDTIRISFIGWTTSYVAATQAMFDDNVSVLLPPGAAISVTRNTSLYAMWGRHDPLHEIEPGAPIA